MPRNRNGEPMNRYFAMVGGVVAALAFCAGARSSALVQAVDDASAVSDASKSLTIEPVDLMIDDGKRKRQIPIRVYLPVENTPAPVVIFSHGLGGSREGASYLGRHWSARGYAAVFLQHPGSDEAVWRDVPLLRRKSALKTAASVQNFKDRVGDVGAAIDGLEKMNASASGKLAGRLDLKRLGMSGHSFGAVTTQAVSGQRHPFGGDWFDKRIKAALILSPSGPRNGVMSAGRAFGDVRIPWMLMTGTNDDSPIGETTPQARLEVFPALPPGNKFELVLKDGQHSAFSDHKLTAGQPPRNPQHWNTILTLSTAFWDAYLREDASAKQWLMSNEVQTVLSPGDRWQKK